MNERVRTYLIEAARQRDKFVFYSDIVKDCELDINLSYLPDHEKLSKILSDVSIFENENERPLITALAIYKDQNKNDHGGGFYRLASSLGFGASNLLQERLFGFEEAQRCRVYWQNDEHYQQFRTIIRQSSIKDLFTRLVESTKYNWAEDWFQTYIDFVSDVKKLQLAVISNPLFEITDSRLYSELSPSVNNYESFMRKWLKEKANGISSRGQSVLSEVNFNLIINDSTFKVLAKNIIGNPQIESYNALKEWWYNNNNINNRPLLINRALAACNPEILSSTVHETKFWTVIEIVSASYGFNFIEHHGGNWFSANEQLCSWLDSQLGDALNSKSTHRLEQILWRNIFVWLIFEELSSSDVIAPNNLIKKTIPKNGYESIPEVRRQFRPLEIDFPAQAKAQKDLGNSGEELVKQYEIKFLAERGLSEKSRLVRLAQVGEGYDVYSFDEFGNEKFIEVKTTNGNGIAPFYLSEPEIDFMNQNLNKYSIYRVFNYDEENNSGEFFEIKGDIQSQILMKPTQFKIYIKKEI